MSFFGPFRVSASNSGSVRILTTTLEAREFIKALPGERREAIHWIRAEKALHRAWMNSQAEYDAARAFRLTLHVDDILLD